MNTSSTSENSPILETIKFSNNWNQKLWCHYFTTIRITGKYEVGQQVNIELNEKHLYTAKIIDKKEFLLEKMNDWMALMDMALPAEKGVQMLKTMYKKYNVNLDKKPFFYYLIERLEKI